MVKISIKKQESGYNKENLARAAGRVLVIVKKAEKKDKEYELQRHLKQISTA